jgi:hypothetical protein
MTDHMQTVQGRCPACGWTSLFLGDGGYVTCSRLDCPSPSAADQLLHGETPPQAALARVRALADRWENALPGQPHHGFAEVLRAALDETTPRPAATQATDGQETPGA